MRTWLAEARRTGKNPREKRALRIDQIEQIEPQRTRPDGAHDRVIDRYQDPVAENYLPMRLKHLLFALTVPTILGCPPVSTRFAPVMTAEERAMVAKLLVYENTLAPGTYKAIGEVRGLSCQMNAKDAYRVSEDDAVTELKRATVRAGGTSVMNVSCTRLERGQRSNCFRAIECRGMAVRLDGNPTE